MSATLTRLLLGARQLFDPVVLRILFKSIAVTLVRTIAPLLGAASATHLFHRRANPAPGS